MAEVIIPGPAGRIEARYQRSSNPNAPVALILHPHPLYGGSMHNKVTYILYQTFLNRGFNVLRFNFRGIGKSEGSFDNGEGELSDAATVLDWLQVQNPNAKAFWVSGFSFGAWITMQLLMRRPEVEGFLVVSPPTNKYDFNFLAPCPVSGQIIQGTSDEVVPVDSVRGLAEKLSKQKGIKIDLRLIENADHFFLSHLPVLNQVASDYLKSRNF
jgi:alpha/beta superfamily hydrolase